MAKIIVQDEYLTGGAEIKAADGTTLLSEDGVETIATGAVDTDALATDAVESADIKDGEVGAADLAATLNLSAKTVTLGAVSTGAISASDDATLTKTDDGAVGLNLTLAQESTSPAANDAVGQLVFQGNDDAANATNYAVIQGTITDPTDGAEFGGLVFNVQDGTGSFNPAVNVTHDGTAGTLTTGTVYNQAGVGTANGTVLATEYGDGRNHITVLTLSNETLDAPTAAAAEGHGQLLYTFPAGVHVHEVTTMNVALQGGGTVDADTPDIGIGSVIATGAVSVLGGTATFEDYVDGSAAADCSGTPTAVGPVGATAGVLTGISLNGAADVKAVHLNYADTWAGADTLTGSGTVILKWSVM